MNNNQQNLKYTKFNIEEAIKKLDFNIEKKFKQTIEIQLSFFNTISTLGSIKKNKWFFCLHFPKPTGKNYITLLVSNDIAASSFGALETNEFVNKFKYINDFKFDVLLASSDCISKLTSPILKKLGQKSLTPKEELCTTSNSISTLLQFKSEFEKSTRKIITFKIDKFASFMYLPISLNKEDLMENWNFLEKFINEELPEKIQSKKKIIIKNIYLKTTMGKRILVEKIN
jgi:ribosomal protein L1